MRTREFLKTFPDLLRHLQNPVCRIMAGTRNQIVLLEHGGKFRVRHGCDGAGKLYRFVSHFSDFPQRAADLFRRFDEFAEAVHLCPELRRFHFLRSFFVQLSVPEFPGPQKIYSRNTIFKYRKQTTFYTKRTFRPVCSGILPDRVEGCADRLCEVGKILILRRVGRRGDPQFDDF